MRSIKFVLAFFVVFLALRFLHSESALVIPYPTVREYDLSPSSRPAIIEFPNGSVVMNKSTATINLPTIAQVNSTFTYLSLNPSNTNYIDTSSFTQTKAGDLILGGRLTASSAAFTTTSGVGLIVSSSAQLATVGGSVGVGASTSSTAKFYISNERTPQAAIPPFLSLQVNTTDFRITNGIPGSGAQILIGQVGTSLENARIIMEQGNMPNGFLISKHILTGPSGGGTLVLASSSQTATLPIINSRPNVGHRLGALLFAGGNNGNLVEQANVSAFAAEPWQSFSRGTKLSLLTTKKGGFVLIPTMELVDNFVGIGESSPTAALHVSSSVILAGLTGAVSVGTTTNSSLLDVFNGSITVRGTNAGIEVNSTNDGSIAPIVSISNAATNEIAGTSSALYFGVRGGYGKKAGIIARQNSNFGRADLHFFSRNVSDQADGGYSDSKITLKYDGNVGIGTTDPTAKLDVAGDALFSSYAISGSTILAEFFGATDEGLAPIFYSANYPKTKYMVNALSGYGWMHSYIFPDSRSWILHNDELLNGLGNLYLKTESTQGGGFNLTRQVWAANGNVGVNTSTPSSLFEVKDGSITVRGTNAGLAVGGNNFIVTTGGNVGVGTGNPDFELIVDNAGSDNRIMVGAGNGTVRTQMVAHTNGNGYMGTYTSHPLVLRTADTDRGAISSVGNFGFGTTAPSSLVDISGGSITIRGTNAGIRIANTGVGGTGKALDVFDGTFTVLQNGRVGIGTSSPSNRLVVVAESTNVANTTIARFQGVPTAGAERELFIAYSSATSTAPQYFDISAIQQGANWFNLILNSGADGNAARGVGIGTTRPSSTFDIGAGSITVRGTNAGINISIPTGGLGLSIIGQTSGDPYMKIQSNVTDVVLGSNNSGTGSGEGFVGSQNAALFAIRSNNTNRIMIAGTGNVGIGTVIPTHFFHVNSSDAFKLTNNVWSIASDLRTKKSTSAFIDGLNVISQIKPIRYLHNGKIGTIDGMGGVGISAQEVEQVAPYMIERKFKTFDSTETLEGIEYEERNGQYAVNTFEYNGTALPFILANAINELKKKNDDLKDLICGNALFSGNPACQ